MTTRASLTLRVAHKQANEVVTDGIIVIGRYGDTLTTAANEAALGEATIDALQARLARMEGDHEFIFLSHHLQPVLVVKNLLQGAPRAVADQAQVLASLLDTRSHITVVVPNGVPQLASPAVLAEAFRTTTAATPQVVTLFGDNISDSLIQAP